jgi:hypothetical protein
VKAWDWNEPDSLTSPASYLPKSWTCQDFEIAKKELVRQVRQRMDYLREREGYRNGVMAVEPRTVEYKFAKLLGFLRPKAQYPRNASYIAKHFNAEERRVLFGLLDHLEEYMPWRGFEMLKVYERVRAAREIEMGLGADKPDKKHK